MSSDVIEVEASRWLAARDAGFGTAERAAEYEAWLAADIRHRVAFLKLETRWKRAERLRELRPLDRDPDPELLRVRSWRDRWPLALAASLIVALVGSGTFMMWRDFGWQHYETVVGGFSRVVLEDGSVIDLNTNSELRVRITAGVRAVTLVRGEGRFQVAHDSSRPFVVSAAGAAVRAVGTAFSVRLRDPGQIDVLVSEGRVDIATPQVPRTPPLAAGEAATVLKDRMSVSRIEPLQLESRLAWTSGRLEFHGDSLAAAIEEFNRYNQRQLRLDSPVLADLRVGGVFNATDPDGFATTLASAFEVDVDRTASDTIVLR